MKAAHLPVDYRDFGRMLKDTREAMGVSLDEVSGTLHIRPKFLLALEKGDLAPMPGDVYVRGYLKRYADYLGYDGQEMLGSITADKPKPAAARYLPPDRSGRKFPSAIVMLVLMGLIGMLAARIKPQADAPSAVEALPARFLPLLDLGTPALNAAVTPPALCTDVLGGLAEELCGEREIVLSRLLAEPPRKTILDQAETLPWQFRALWPREEETPPAANAGDAPSAAVTPSFAPPEQTMSPAASQALQDYLSLPAPAPAAVTAGPATQTPVATPPQPRYNEPLWMNPFRDSGHH